MKASIPVQAGKIYTITITGMGQTSEGIGRYEDFTIFVPYALPGEKVSVKINLVKKNYATGEIVDIIESVHDRINPRCSIYNRCGACQMQHSSYEAQLEAKRQKVVDVMCHIAKQNNILIHPTLKAPSAWYYRNKMQFPIGRQKKKIVVGCYEHASHDIVDTKECFIQKHSNTVVANVIREMIRDLKLMVYDEKTHYGLLRHVVARTNRDESEVMVILVTAQPKLPKQREIVEYIRQRVPNVKSIVQNINTAHNNIIMGPTCRTLWGASYIRDTINSIVFNISAQSFFQVNTEQAENLYNKALEYAGLTGRELVIDAYCGTGSISLCLAKKAKHVIGMEIVPQAIKDAIINAKNNKIRNVEFMTGDAAKLMPIVYKRGTIPDVIITDPPRAGCDAKVLEVFANMKPKRIVYVSCNPATLARDIEILSRYGYKATEIQPVDMFPQTAHVECVALLTKTYN